MKIDFKNQVLKNTLKLNMLMACLLGFLTVLPVTAYALRDDVLVIVNDNSIDSPQIGAYYAQQRSINPANIVHVRIRNGYFIDWGEFRSLRDQIIAFMQANTLDDPALIPATCVDGDIPYYCAAAMQQLRQHTKIRYLVTTRGIPTRMTVTGSSLFSPNSPTSVDNYLKYWLINYFATDVTLKFTEREQAFLDGRGMRTVVPSIDKELIVGRIDGLNQEAALNLVDRAIQAEQNGIYGNLLSNTQVLHWKDHSINRQIYQSVDGFLQSWRYQMGIFGESRFECLDYLNFPLTSASGLTPLDCHVQMTPAKERGPANTVSRQPLANDTLMYSGWLDGSVSASNFSGLLNWRKQPSCNVLLCENSATPDACRAASTDVYREINTQCVGVADGFMGYNHQSYPLSYLGSWPTAWYPDTGTANWNSQGSGDVNNLAFPEVIDFYGLGDKYSLWFRSADQASSPLCYTDNSYTSTAPCPDQRKINLNQKISFPEKSLDPANPSSFQVTFWYRAFNVTTATDLQARLFVHESGAGNQQIDYGVQLLGSVPAGSSSWKVASAVFTLDPALHSSLLYDGIKVRIQSSGLFAGELGIDIISITDLQTNQNLVQNGMLSEGHKQVAMGDYAASFLSRLNGTAFWGSVSHHQAGGAAFLFNQLETLIYFMRGLPLGDAVWFDESQNSGILYGDPLYSPAAVYLHPVNVDDNLQGLVELTGDTINGQSPVFVDTQYAVDYCAGTDFFTCDQDPFAWIATGISGSGGQKNQLLGSWDTSLMIPGEYVLRLAVTSNNLSSGKSQTFYDYYSVTVGSINTPPVASIGFIQINEDTAGSGQISVVDPDVGDTHSFKVSIAPKLGALTVSASGLVNYSPFADKNGRDIMLITVTDSAGNTVDTGLLVFINPVNDAPRPTVADLLINEDSSGTIQVAANDPDVGDIASYSIVSIPAKGNASVSTTGLVTYTPFANVTGTENLTVNVKDVAGASTNVTFLITVSPVNDVPVINAASMVTPEDTSITTQISVIDPDINDIHTFSITGIPVSGNAMVSATGLVSYTPAANYFGSDTIGVTVVDSAGGQAMLQIPVQVNPVNDAPIPTAVNLTINEDSSGTVQVEANDPDVGDITSYSIVSTPIMGIAGISATGLVTYTPFANTTGTENLTVNVKDVAGASTNVTFLITVSPVNDVPVINAASMVTPEDTSTTTQITVIDPDFGDTHTFSITGIPVAGNAVVSATGLVSYTPAANYFGSDTIGVTVVDSAGGQAMLQIPVQVNSVNDVPVASATAIITDADLAANSQITVTDADIGDSHTYSITTLPLHGAAQVSLTGLVTYTPNSGYSGTDQLVITVADSASASSNVSISVTVNSVAAQVTTPTTFTIPDYSPVTIEGTIEAVSGVWVTILGKDVYVPAGTITYLSSPDNPVLNIGDHVTISADTVFTYLVATSIVRDNTKSKISVTGPVSYIDPDNKRLGIAYINVQTDAFTNFKKFGSSVDPIASVTAQNVLTASSNTLQVNGSFVAKDLEKIN